MESKPWADDDIEEHNEEPELKEDVSVTDNNVSEADVIETNNDDGKKLDDKEAEVKSVDITETKQTITSSDKKIFNIDNGNYDTILIKKNIKVNNNKKKRYLFLLKIPDTDKIIYVNENVPGYWQLKYCKLQSKVNIDLVINNNKPYVLYIYPIKDIKYYGKIIRLVNNENSDKYNYGFLVFTNHLFANSLKLYIPHTVSDFTNNLNFKDLNLGEVCSFTIKKAAPSRKYEYEVDQIQTLSSHNGVIVNLNKEKGYGYVKPDDSSIKDKNKKEGKNDIYMWNEHIDNIHKFTVTDKVTFFMNDNYDIIKLYPFREE